MPKPIENKTLHTSRGKLMSSTALGLCLLPLALALSNVARAQSVLPTGGKVVSGGVNIGAPANNALTINQTSAHGIINWNSFSVGQPNSVTFNQPDASSATLNRVTGSTSTTIAGQLKANGQI
jgi:large exoprotein involved in heme utilization and adhesion